MPAIRDLSGLRLLRPLLAIDKAALEQTLRAAGQPWLDDPSNRNPAFTRSHLRRADLDVASLTSEAHALGRKRRDADRRAAEALVRCTCIDPAGFATIDQTAFRRLPQDLARDLLARILMTTGGRSYPPRSDALSRLHDVMGEAIPGRARTLANCVILAWGKHWLIRREHVSPERLALRRGQWQRWDDRFLVRLMHDHQSLSLEVLGDRARHGERTLIRKGKTRCLPKAVEQTLPAIVGNGRLVAIPHLGLYETLLEQGHIDLRFCPKIPLANAPFMPHISGVRGGHAFAPVQR